MRFTKMQGCGNDYIYVDCFREKLPADLSAANVDVQVVNGPVSHATTTYCNRSWIS